MKTPMKRHMKLKTLIALVAAFGLAGPAYAQQLSSEEIVKLLKGTTIETVRGGNDWPTTITFNADGTLSGQMEHGRRGTELDEGKWWTNKEGMYCRQWEDWGRGRKKCHLLELQKDGKTIKVVDRDGNVKSKWVLK